MQTKVAVVGKRKDAGGDDLDAMLRVRVPRALLTAARTKARAQEYPTDVSAVVRVLLTRWVKGRGGARRK